MSSTEIIEVTKLRLDEQATLDLDNAEKIRVQQNLLKFETLAEVVYDKLNKKVANLYLSIYSCTDKELKIYIYENIKSLFVSLSYDKNHNAEFNKKRRMFHNNLSAHKARWRTMALSYLEKDDTTVQQYKRDTYPDMDDITFKKTFKKNIRDWKESNTLMVDFPLYPYLSNAKSVSSAFNYDIGVIVYDIYSKFRNDNPVYKQLDILVERFSPHGTKKLPKYEVVNDNSSKDDILLSQTTLDNEYVEIKEQVSLLDKVDEYNTIDTTNIDAQTELSYLLNNDLTPDTKVFVDNIVNTNKIMFQPFDDFDLDIISYVINHADSNFYIDRKIRIVEKDILIYLGKNPNQTKSRTWLQNRINKIVGRHIIVVEKKKDSTKVLYDKYVIFDRVVFDITEKNSFKSMDLYISNAIYNNILREDTINVYRDDFLTIKNSKYPDAILLIYNLQLLRFSSYQMNKITVQVSTSYFVDILKIKTKNKRTIHLTIQDYLNQFVLNKVIIQSFDYDVDNGSWSITFIELTDRDLKVLMNSRKNYQVKAKIFTHLLTD